MPFLKAGFDHVSVYRLACLAGVVVIFIDGYLSDLYLVFPDYVIWLRSAVMMCCGILLILSYISEMIRRRFGELFVLICLLSYAYCGAVIHSTQVGFNEVSGSLLVLGVTATVFHRSYLILTAMLGAIVIFLAFGLAVETPVLSYHKYVMSVVVFAGFFSVVMISNVQARRQRSHSEQQANAWFENASDALIQSTTDQPEVFKVNAAARKMFETDNAQTIVDIVLAAYLQESQTTRSRQDWLQAATNLQELDEVLKFTTVGGRQFWGDMSLRKTYLGSEEMTLTRITDVSARVAHEEALEHARAEAENTVHTRTRFLANMSHEIRTPMNGVIGMTSLLLDTPLNDQQRSFLETIRMSGDSLLSIINEILDFSKIDADQIELEEVEFDLEECLVDAMSIISPAARENNLELILGINPFLPANYRGDVSRIRQILVNLLSNAVKFTSEGSVSLEVKIDSAIDGHADVRFDITDTGVGIHAEKLDSLFDPFTQADSSTTREFGGTGLGLTISKRLATLMGGDVTVRSEPSHGSCFSFTCRLMAGATPESMPDKSVLADKRVLLFCTQNARPLCEYSLKETGLIVTVADINQPLDTLPDKLDFDLVIVDSAGEAPKLLPTQLKEAGSTAPIMLVTPLGSGQVQSSQYHRVVIKPIRPKELLTAICDSLTGKFSSIQKHNQSNLPTLQLDNISFLLAEDNAVNQKVALSMLKRLGIRADAVGNGKEAIELLQKRHYDVVFMDMQMPEIDGLEASVLIRQSTELGQPYIIAMTANAMREDRENCLKAGMNDHIAKPVRLQDIHRSVATALDELRGAQPH